MKKSKMILITVTLGLAATLNAAQWEPVLVNLKNHKSTPLELKDKNGNECRLDTGKYNVSLHVQEKDNLELHVLDTEKCVLDVNVLKNPNDLAKANENGQKYSVTSTVTKKPTGSYSEDGEVSCDGPGICYHTEYNFSTNETETTFGYHHSCSGTQKVVFLVESFRYQYEINFTEMGEKPSAVFDIFIKRAQERNVIKEIGSCDT